MRASRCSADSKDRRTCGRIRPVRNARRPCPEVFQNIDWSTEKVLTQTRQQAIAADLKYIEQGGWDDVDDIASLRRLLVRSPESATGDYVRRHLDSLTAV